MAGLPPPPITDPSGSFAWLDWYNQLTNYLNVTGNVPWSVVNKAGSNLSDLQNRDHAMLNSIAGTGVYHLSQTEQGRVTATVVVNQLAGAPTATQIPAGYWAIYKDTTGGTLALYANDGGTIKKVALV